MTGPFHTYGPSCLLVDDEPALSSFYSLLNPPEIKSHFFYVSSLPIDDPLAPVPAPTGQITGTPNPFSAKDNAALEAAWRDIGKAQQEPHQFKGAAIAVPGRGLAGYRGVATREDLSVGSSKSSNPISLPDDPALRNFKGQSVESYSERRRVLVSSLDTSYNDEIPRTSVTFQTSEPSTSLNESPSGKNRRNSPSEKDEEEARSLRPNRSRDASISGSPFIRAPISPSYNSFGRSVDSLLPNDGIQDWQAEARQSGLGRSASKRSNLRATVSLEETAPDSSEQEIPRKDVLEQIPVGASRLYLVELPSLKMKPIYWNPLHDISGVMRATWFYKNTMLPVETVLANKLEEGYVELKPWTETWQDELNSCVENGADAELKIVHRLWPTGELDSANLAEADGLDTNESESADAQEARSFDKNQAAGDTGNQLEAVKPHLSSSVIYVNAKSAQILRPSLLPSASKGRRPLFAIRKERQVGIPVVRGFSRKLWDKLHPTKPNAVDVRQYIRRTSRDTAPAAPFEQTCYACKMEDLRTSPSDLVFVIHGIGQKLSQRMESFAFTHAINSFRRQVSMELYNEPVWPHVRQDHGGIMVLPINWRTTLSLEEQTLDSMDMEDPFANDYTLSDITPQTLPAIRSLISDVMLDIPYYLSHHKPKMIKAVVKEANRIYRLWCRNNPNFQDTGRVHILAHSLGSVMALDILSHQPTHVPKFDFSNTPLHSDIFEFDTRNLFLCGSPVGFFLLLNKATLLPRKGREKPGSEGEDLFPGVAGEAGKYGCMAVDNLYNIVHTTDPIAYRVNAAVDTDLSNSLKTASIPSSTSSFWQSLGSVFKWNQSPTFATSSKLTRPGMTSKLPSTVEMETHDFTREEIAEKRMLLLNDNAQVDFYLSGGGGPLNIQYLNMLSAHSSYWTLTDFVRFLVVEIARKQGRDGTLLAFRAEKKKGWKYTKGL
ncbi:hypothetical protein N7495_005388 [Penicillium taxi]|uniref:uncharacterized protein n=1 Tax=Penicillium taxi TaxID=168475 RepID=UPI0025452F0F|nr:uncharacterized protein N7495_005388 [Penicillium taxi]KAJ5893697.1 hypothetical protein N7495_005388 [Penicillium taxi]